MTQLLMHRSDIKAVWFQGALVPQKPSSEGGERPGCVFTQDLTLRACRNTAKYCTWPTVHNTGRQIPTSAFKIYQRELCETWERRGALTSNFTNETNSQWAGNHALSITARFKPVGTREVTNGDRRAPERGSLQLQTAHSPVITTHTSRARDRHSYVHLLGFG